MPEAIVVTSPAPEAPRPRPLKRLILPFLMLVGGAAAGAAGAILVPPLLPQAGAQKPPPPKVAPLEYLEIENSFTANLKDTGRFVQVKIAVSTQGGQPVLEAVKRHHVAIVSAVLGVLAETTEGELSASGGRDALTARMRIAINDILQRKSGIAGIDDVFLTSFVLQ
jgi:flagellar FliL protein